MLKLHTLALAGATAIVTVTAAPAAAHTGGDLDCADFATQAEAQAELQAHPGDPNNLDRDNDGVACETHFGMGDGGDGDDNADGGNVDQDNGTAPGAGVDTGAGGTAASTDLALPLGATGLVFLAGGAILMRRRQESVS